MVPDRLDAKRGRNEQVLRLSSMGMGRQESESRDPQQIRSINRKIIVNSEEEERKIDLELLRCIFLIPLYLFDFFAAFARSRSWTENGCTRH